MKAILNGRVLLPDCELRGKALLYGEKIISLTDPDAAKAQADEIIDAQGAYVAPGLTIFAKWPVACWPTASPPSCPPR